jgi:hypothetical protein
LLDEGRPQSTRRSATAIWVIVSLTAILMICEVALSGAADNSKVNAGTPVKARQSSISRTMP